VAAPLVTKAQLEACLGPDVVRRIFDQNGDGVADKAALDQICAHASSKVRGAIPGYDPAELTPENSLISTELARLALDAAVALTAKWFPAATPFATTWIEMMSQVDKELEMVRKGQANLGARTNPAEADHSVSVASSDPGQGSYWP
jgi:hypothetical protein